MPDLEPTPDPAPTPAPVPTLAFNVRGFGATGNGTTDDTVAVQSAINKAAANGGVVYFPAGTYLVQPFTIPAGVVLQGVNGEAYHNITSTVPNVNTLSRLELKSGSAGPLLSPDDGGTNLASDVRIFDLCLDCNGLTEPAISLPDEDSPISRSWTIERSYIVDVGGATGYATYVGRNDTGVAFLDCVWFDGASGSPAGNSGVGWYGADGSMENCYVAFFRNAGLVALGGNSQTLFVQGGGVFNCVTDVVVGGEGCTFEGVSVDHAYNDGIDITKTGTALFGCQFDNNSSAATNGWSDIAIGTDNINVTIIGCFGSERAPDISNDPKYFIDARGHTGVVLDANGNSCVHALGTAFTDYDGLPGQ